MWYLVIIYVGSHVEGCSTGSRVLLIDSSHRVVLVRGCFLISVSSNNWNVAAEGGSQADIEICSSLWDCAREIIAMQGSMLVVAITNAVTDGNTGTVADLSLKSRSSKSSGGGLDTSVRLTSSNVGRQARCMNASFDRKHPDTLKAVMPAWRLHANSDSSGKNCRYRPEVIKLKVLMHGDNETIFEKISGVEGLSGCNRIDKVVILGPRKRSKYGYRSASIDSCHPS